MRPKGRATGVFLVPKGIKVYPEAAPLGEGYFLLYTMGTGSVLVSLSVTYKLSFI